jgi:tRNA modification GTPase
MDPSTIAALATPPGTGAISIIRLSGPRALEIAAAIFKPASPATPFESHRLVYGRVIDPQGGRVLDEVLLSVMRGPRSYTREDVVEINAHGGRHAARAILELAVRAGARLAEPGEFTRRAFLNGRIDLTQAEAVCDLIRARSARSLEASAALLTGRLREKLEYIQVVIQELWALVEAGIDFPEDAAEAADTGAVRRRIAAEVAAPLAGLIRNTIEGRPIRDGVAVAIVGRPNVGKSSLMNRLLGKERSIVTEVPGTTRDVVEDRFYLEGLEFYLQDTAGLHPSPDMVERIGMAKTLESSGLSDLVLLVIEAHRPIGVEDRRIYEQVGSKPLILILNKIDLWQGPGDGTDLPAGWRTHPCVRLSALTGSGIDELRSELVRTACDDLPATDALIPNLRQKSLMERALAAATAADADLERNAGPELVAVNLTLAADCIAEILGTRAGAEILDAIFSRFCIGK